MAGRGTSSGRVTLEQADVFTHVAKARTLREASRNVGKTVEAVRAIVNRLTEATGLGQPLITTSAKGEITLTADGEHVAFHAQQLLEIERSMLARRRSVTVAAYSSVALKILNEALDQGYGDGQKQLPFEFANVQDATRATQGTQLINRLRTYETDIAIAPRGWRQTGFRHVPLYDWRLLAINERYAGQKTIAVSALAGQPLMVSPSGHMSRELLDAAAAEVGVELTIQLEQSDQSLMRELAARANSPWVAVIPDDAVGPALSAEGAAITGLNGRLIGHGYELYHRTLGSYASARREEIQQAVQLITVLARAAD